MDVNYTYCGDHFAIYTNMESYLEHLKQICYMSIISQFKNGKKRNLYLYLSPITSHAPSALSNHKSTFCFYGIG